MNDNLKNLLMSIVLLDIEQEDYFNKLEVLCKNDEVSGFSIKNFKICLSFHNTGTRFLHCTPLSLQSVCKKLLSLNGFKFPCY